MSGLVQVGQWCSQRARPSRECGPYRRTTAPSPTSTTVCLLLCRLINDAETSLLAQQAECRLSSFESQQGLCPLQSTSRSISDGLLKSVAELTEEDYYPAQQASTLCMFCGRGVLIERQLTPSLDSICSLPHSPDPTLTHACSLNYSFIRTCWLICSRLFSHSHTHSLNHLCRC